MHDSFQECGQSQPKEENKGIDSGSAKRKQLDRKCGKPGNSMNLV
jgi:hypothetical protein